MRISSEYESLQYKIECYNIGRDVSWIVSDCICLWLWGLKEMSASVMTSRYRCIAIDRLCSFSAHFHHSLCFLPTCLRECCNRFVCLALCSSTNRNIIDSLYIPSIAQYQLPTFGLIVFIQLSKSLRWILLRVYQIKLLDKPSFATSIVHVILSKAIFRWY
jgi:hypothetical protein